MAGIIKDYRETAFMGVFRTTLQERKKETHICFCDNKLYLKNSAYEIREDTRSFFYSLKRDDILTVSSPGIVNRIYEDDTKDAVLFLTNHCNSNCRMCPVSENARRIDASPLFEELIRYIDLLPENVRHICITGGEPTLRGEELISILQKCREKFQYTDFQMLTNGRSFSNLAFCKKCARKMPDNIEIGIPLHSANEQIHDYITQSKGSFQQTVRGIDYMLKLRQRIEIRIVIHSLNMNGLLKLAKFIMDRFPDCLRVTFIGMEMHGNAARNRKDLWIDYREAFSQAKPAVDMLYKNGIDVCLYNFPLCTVDERYWYICKQSITPWKVRYYEECDKCIVKSGCSGFFVSTMCLYKSYVQPIVR